MMLDYQTRASLVHDCMLAIRSELDIAPNYIMNRLELEDALPMYSQSVFEEALGELMDERLVRQAEFYDQAGHFSGYRVALQNPNLPLVES